MENSNDISIARTLLILMKTNGLAGNCWWQGGCEELRAGKTWVKISRGDSLLAKLQLRAEEKTQGEKNVFRWKYRATGYSHRLLEFAYNSRSWGTSSKKNYFSNGFSLLAYQTLWIVCLKTCNRPAPENTTKSLIWTKKSVGLFADAQARTEVTKACDSLHSPALSWSSCSLVRHFLFSMRTEDAEEICN